MDFSADLDLSADDKIAKYNELNKTIGSGSGYVNYIPNSNTGGAQTVDQPTIDINTLLPKNNQMPLFNSFSTLSQPMSDTKSDIKSVTPAKPTVGDVEMGKSNPYKAVVPFVPYTPYNATKNPPSMAAKEAYEYYVNEKQLSPQAAAGIVGNLYQESGLDPTRQQNNGGPGRGVAQWTVNGRWQGFQKWATQNGKDPNGLHTQLDYILQEPGQEGAIKKTLTAKTANEAALAFGKYYEAPKDSEARWDIRQGVANALVNM